MAKGKWAIALAAAVVLAAAAAVYLRSPGRELSRLVGDYRLVSVHVTPGAGFPTDAPTTDPEASGTMTITHDRMQQSVQIHGMQESAMATGRMRVLADQHKLEVENELGGAPTLLIDYELVGDRLTTRLDVGTYQETDTWERVRGR